MTRLSDVFLQHGRALEWLTSLVLLSFAVTLAMPGDSLAATPAFRPLVAAGLTEPLAVLVLVVVSSVRMAALYINGAWIRTPRLRFIGALLSAPVFAVLGSSAALPWLFGDTAGLSTGVTTYLLLAGADIVAAYRSAADAAYVQHARPRDA